MTKRNIAIITARGGSKRIPKKNIRDFCGKPIIAYSIEAALGSGVFDEVMVSTDSEEIADVAKKYGASVPFMRSEKTSGDFATTVDVLKEVLDKFTDTGKTFEGMCCLYPTAPFVTADKLKSAYDIMEKNSAFLVMSVVPFSFPPQRALVIDGSTDSLKYKFPEEYGSRSQDLEKWYHDAGQFYFFDVKEFTARNGNVLDNIYPMVLPETEVQDIDTEEDWKLAEMKYSIISKPKAYAKQ